MAAGACASVASTTRLAPLGLAEEMESGDEGVEDLGSEQVGVGEEGEGPGREKGGAAE